MTFIAISNRLTEMATCSNRKYNIWDFMGLTCGFSQFSGVHMIGHTRFVASLFYDFY